MNKIEKLENGAVKIDGVEYVKAEKPAPDMSDWIGRARSVLQDVVSDHRNGISDGTISYITALLKETE